MARPRPSSMVRLVLRLIGAYPVRALAVFAVPCVVTLALARARAPVVETAQAETARGEHARCRLEQTWRAGNVYDHEGLSFYRDGNGYWYQADRHGEQEHIKFRWQRRHAELVIAFARTRRVVHFTMHRTADSCVLRFDRPPLPGAMQTFYGG